MSTKNKQIGTLSRAASVGLLSFLLFISVSTAEAASPGYYPPQYDAPIEAVYDVNSDFEVAENYIPKALPRSKNSVVADARSNQMLPMTASPVSQANRIMPRYSVKNIQPVSGFRQRAAFDSEMQPGQVVIPQNLLMDDAEMQTVPIPNIPRTKPLHQAKNYPMLASNAARVVDTENETIYDENAMGNQNNMVYEYPEQMGSFYDEYAGLDNVYSHPPLVRPFGMGALDNLTVFGGVTGFKSKLDGGVGGNFGYYEGVNWSGPATPQNTFVAQLGFRAVQSNTVGSPYYYPNTAHSSYHKGARNQYFVTAGAYKRDAYYPFQGGVAMDWCQDDRYNNIGIQQVRMELSLQTFSHLEYGFIGSFGANTTHSRVITSRENYFHQIPAPGRRFDVRADDYYQGFVRRHIATGGTTEFRMGASRRGDVLINGLSEFAINDNLAFNGGFSVAIPKEGHGKYGYRQESWEISAGVIYYFRGGACSKSMNPCRPMFNVAGNGTFVNRIW